MISGRLKSNGYKWVIDYDDVVHSGSNIYLVDENFERVNFYKVRKDDLDFWIERKLTEHAIYCVACTDEGNIGHYELIPKAQKMRVCIAPLYRKTNGNYEKLSDKYTGKAYVPSSFESVRKEYETCKQEVKDDWKRIFEYVFNANSKDGLTACINVVDTDYNMEFDSKDANIAKKYIPEGYTEICSKKVGSIKETIFIKDQDFNHTAILIQVPEGFKELVYGKGRENIQKIANKLNICYIEVG